MFALSNPLPSNIKHTIYNSLFRSFVEYGIAAWWRIKVLKWNKLARSKNMQLELLIIQKKLNIAILFSLSMKSLS